MSGLPGYHGGSRSRARRAAIKSPKLMNSMKKLFIYLLAFGFFSSAAFGVEFEREGWPGKDRPKLAARNDQLLLHETHDLESASRQLKYKSGWRIAWDQSKVITRKSAVWTVIKEIDKGTCGKLVPGDRVELLQYEIEGWGTFRVGDKLCSLKATRSGDFDKAGQRPQVEWWVRVLDNTKSRIGWLLVDSDQVELLP